MSLENSGYVSIQKDLAKGKGVKLGVRKARRLAAKRLTEAGVHPKDIAAHLAYLFDCKVSTVKSDLKAQGLPHYQRKKTSVDYEDIREMVEKGRPVSAIARKIGRTYNQVYVCIRDYEEEKSR